MAAGLLRALCARVGLAARPGRCDGQSSNTQVQTGHYAGHSGQACWTRLQNILHEESHPQDLTVGHMSGGSRSST